VPLAVPLNGSVRWLADTQDRAMKKRIVEVADEVGATSVICERFEALDRGKGAFGTADSTVRGGSQPKACTRTAYGMGGGNSIIRTACSTAKATMRCPLHVIM
jgi:hypothetical protein